VIGIWPVPEELDDAELERTGPRGETGATGPAGSPGIVGEKGEAGPPGPQGSSRRSWPPRPRWPPGVVASRDGRFIKAWGHKGSDLIRTTFSSATRLGMSTFRPP